MTGVADASAEGRLISEAKTSDRINRIDRIIPALRTRAGKCPAAARNYASMLRRRRLILQISHPGKAETPNPVDPVHPVGFVKRLEAGRLGGVKLGASQPPSHSLPA
jgi:hypothetical protein